MRTETLAVLALAVFVVVAAVVIAWGACRARDACGDGGAGDGTGTDSFWGGVPGVDSYYPDSAAGAARGAALAAGKDAPLAADPRADGVGEILPHDITGRLYASGLRKPMMFTYSGFKLPYGPLTAMPGGSQAYETMSAMARAEKTGELPENWGIPAREPNSVLASSGAAPLFYPDHRPPLGPWSDSGESKFI